MAMAALQATAGNAAVVQMLRLAGHPGAAQEQHQHSTGCGHQQAGAPPVQRSTVHDILRAPGRPLDDTTRADMESRLGADFSDVRIHTDSAAKASAAEVGARAYTSGSHVVIGDGGGDNHTLAHELTHVIQQRQGPVAGTDNCSGVSVSDPSDRFEREAEANARRVMSGPAVQREVESTPQAATHGAPAVQRIRAVPGVAGVRASQNGMYIVPSTQTGEANEIWVHESAAPPRYCVVHPALDPGNIGGMQGTYTPYMPSTRFLADCSHTAEEVMHQASLDFEAEQDASAFTSTGQTFGETHGDNVTRAQAHAGSRPPGMTDLDEAPQAGQAFATIETAWMGDVHNDPDNAYPRGPKNWPYHVAAVVATDGGDQITLEQTAGDTNAVPGEGHAGIFDIYQAGHQSKSFHGRYANGRSFTRGAITVTLFPINVGRLALDPTPRD
ncbi:DUF4157 domain-containing protein [Streptomyces sp. NBC_00083]|uniref:eCIS core domain-containing protein n=1 Tax=Streptomyces sp. NBC_00083 TaxID=2975647 RepID=UPI002258B980|nr:DUF4157 domain-containing protein [Streptomyces sp. NBC_00083]MCX5384741.1 DUF4157 domain-containing protein [Streptomyces sp. NBC_00083]